MKNVLIVVFLVLVVAAGSIYYLLNNKSDESYVKEEPVAVEPNNVDESMLPIIEEEENQLVEIPKTERGAETNLGKSAGGNDIKAYHFGTGETEVMFIGGIHGGYSWNTASLAFEMIDWLKSNPSVVPKNLTVTVIPVLNPDGLKTVTGTIDKFTTSQVNASDVVRVSGRFNANDVDLNRNFDCEWKPKGTWQNREVSGGTAAFSEPESRAIRTYVTGSNPAAVVTWYSAAGGVYASNCKNGILPETLTLTNLYAKAASYPAHEEFNYYEITGDMVNWFASQNIPAISVLLTNREQTEWNKNRAGIEAVLKHYAE